MRKLAVVVLLTFVLLTAAAFWFLTRPASIPPATLNAHTPNAENGRTMFFAGGCASCHASPNQDDRLRLGGGLGLKSPFGSFYVPNISSDANDGLGRWDEAQFVTAMLKGTSPGGEHYYPSFPYTSYQKMPVEDVQDLFAFLKTLPAVQGKVRAHDVSFPFNLRPTVGLWKLLYLDGKAFQPDPAQSDEWNRGAYLINGPGHCAECHSPRDWRGGIKAALRFAGGPNPEGEGWVPNITQAALADWTEEDFVELLSAGATPQGDKVSSSMAPVIRNTSQLSPADRKAMAAYLKSLPSVEGPRPPARK